ncbi:MAG: purine-nucleoside phosphorylase [Clostridiaceae bacterium]|nr:purine-nucleoside phosphorylase [Clostridiaceae bacterium]
MIEKIKETAGFLIERLNTIPSTAIILGSGLNNIADMAEDAVILPYNTIPNFPTSTVEGHEGALVRGKLFSKEIIILKGRVHCYEGYSMGEVAFPVKVLSYLGVKNLIVTNAAGGINPCFEVGDVMAITDHIKLSHDSPLFGKNIDEIGVRFPDMTEAYPEELINIAAKAAEKFGITLRRGVYAYMSGPNYETKAEIKALSILGADAVGMSTVPEVIAAVHGNMKVLGLSWISNKAAGVSGEKLSHEDVLKASKSISHKLTLLLSEILNKI